MEIKILTILSLILLYWLSGYLPGRPIKPKRNRWHAWGPFNQIWGFIDGDEKSFLPKSMPWPFNSVFFTLTYNKFIEGDINATLPTKSADGKTITYSRARTEIIGIKNPIQTRTEEVTRLRKTEIHPYIVEVTLPKLGGTFYLVFTLKIKIKNPMKVLTMDEFLVFVGNQLNDRVYPWAIAYEAELFKSNSLLPIEEQTSTIMDAIIGLNIDNDSAIKIKVEKPDGSTEELTLRSYMNKVVREYGGVIPDFSLDVGYDEEIKKILDLRNKQNQEKEKRKNEINASLTRDVVRTREKADELQEIKLDKKELVDVVIPEMEAQANANEKSNGAWNVGTLAIGDIKTAIVMPQGRRRAKKGGTNVTT